MIWTGFDFFPIMGEKLNDKNTLILDFTEKNQELKTVDLSNTEDFDQFVFDQLKHKSKKNSELVAIWKKERSTDEVRSLQQLMQISEIFI